ncbi:hypothetical protein Droror1_Dr00016185 [Drosera rotundifolia]
MTNNATSHFPDAHLPNLIPPKCFEPKSSSLPKLPNPLSASNSPRHLLSATAAADLDVAIDLFVAAPSPRLLLSAAAATDLDASPRHLLSTVATADLDAAAPSLHFDLDLDVAAPSLHFDLDLDAAEACRGSYMLCN